MDPNPANSPEQLLLDKEKALQSALTRCHGALIQTVYAISAVEAHHDPYTGKHQRSVGVLSFAIGRTLGLEIGRLEGLYLGAMLHDVGKVAVPKEVLMKPSSLTPEEYALVKTHTRTGPEILARISLPWPLGTIVAQHHERLDGSGYPLGLRAEAICLESRIVAVADVFDAICEQRPYRQASGVRVALEELDRAAGRTLDAAVVGALKATVTGEEQDLSELLSRLQAEVPEADFAAGFAARPGAG